MKKLDTIKFSIILTTVFLVVLIIFAVMLPWLVTWYVQLAQRHESLATTMMVTCYPCAPFTAVVLLSLRKLLKNIQQKNLDKVQNSKLLKYMSISCLIISVITLIAGRYYLPFYIVAATFMFLSLIIFAFKSISDELFTDK
ncbi:MAG: hypothetical protein IJD00_02845 [Clostridia bacterium]|nr:hypothetical protein [Clostridia bacterium]MBQ3057866.1 hypothetical protein [Clostridia bacterium]